MTDKTKKRTIDDDSISIQQIDTIKSRNYDNYLKDADIQSIFQNSDESGKSTIQRSIDGRLSEICRILRRALFDDDVKGLKAVCRNTHEPDLFDNEGNSPLHMAARMGRRKCLKWLLESTDLPVMAFNAKGQTCAHEAAQQGHFRCLKEAITHGMSHPGFITKKDEDGMTVLHMAVCNGDIEPIQWLVTKYGGVLVPMKNNDGQNVLHIAAATGNVDLIRFLYSADRKILNEQDNCGATVVHYAAYHGQLDAIKYLIDSLKSDVRILTHRNETCLHIASYGGFLDIVKFLLKRVEEVLIWSLTSQGGNIFHFAAACGSVEVIKHLMKRSPVRSSCECTVADKTGNTPVHEAAAGGHSNAIKYFWGIGLDISMENKVGETPYLIAVGYEHFACAEMIKSLLRAQGKEPHVFSNRNRQKLLGDDKRRRWTINATTSSKRSQRIYNKSKGEKWPTGGRGKKLDNGEFNRRLSGPEIVEQSDIDILAGEFYFRPNDDENYTKSPNHQPTGHTSTTREEAFSPSKTLALQRIFLPVKNGSFSSRSDPSPNSSKPEKLVATAEDGKVGEFKLQSSTRHLGNGHQKLRDPYNGIESPVVERIKIRQKFRCSPSPDLPDKNFKSPLLDRANFLDDVDCDRIDSRQSIVPPFSDRSDDSFCNIPSTDYDDSDESKTASYDLICGSNRNSLGIDSFDPTAELDAVIEAECVQNSFSSNDINSKIVQSKYYYEDFDVYGEKSNRSITFNQNRSVQSKTTESEKGRNVQKTEPNRRGKGKVRLQISEDGLDFYELVRRDDKDSDNHHREHSEISKLSKTWSDFSDNGYGSISDRPAADSSSKMAALPSVCTVCRGSGKPDSTISIVDDPKTQSVTPSTSTSSDGKIISCTLIIDGHTYTMSADDDPNNSKTNTVPDRTTGNNVIFESDNLKEKSNVPFSHKRNVRRQRLRSMDAGESRVDSLLSDSVDTPDLYIHYTIYKRNTDSHEVRGWPEDVEATV